MAIEHKDIPEGQIHEPKGITSSVANSIYHSSANGSGVWKKVGVSSLKGVAGDGGVAGLFYVSDGVDSFLPKVYAGYGQMGFTNNSVGFSVTAASDPTLQTLSNYQLLTGTGAPWLQDVVYGNTFASDRIVAAVQGVYRVDFDVNIKSTPGSGTVVGFRPRINGSTWGPRSAIDQVQSTTTKRSIHGHCMLTLAAGEYVQLYVASSDGGSLVISDATLSVDLRRG